MTGLRLHTNFDWLRRRDKEIATVAVGGSCANCKHRHVVKQYCKFKKKQLRTIHSYCDFWEKVKDVELSC